MIRICAVLGLGALTSCTLFSQTAGKAPAFEVASVKANKSGDTRDWSDVKGTQLTAINAPLMSLLAHAYDVPFDRIEGPGWLTTERYDIVAKLPSGTTRATLNLMMQGLLIERFKLRIHHDQTPAPVYALVLGKSGPKLRVASGSGQPRYTCGPAGIRMTCKADNTTMAQLAADLPRWVSTNWFGRPVVDQTTLADAYDFSLTWTPTRRPDDIIEPPGLSLFEALQDQLGLKLQLVKASVDRVVVDHIERVPIEN